VHCPPALPQALSEPPGSQAVPEQQPVGQDSALQTQPPATHTCPLTQPCGQLAPLLEPELELADDPCPGGAGNWQAQRVATIRNAAARVAVRLRRMPTLVPSSTLMAPPPEVPPRAPGTPFALQICSTPELIYLVDPRCPLRPWLYLTDPRDPRPSHRDHPARRGPARTSSDRGRLAPQAVLLIFSTARSKCRSRGRRRRCARGSCSCRSCSPGTG
jgi:hypothetical protein